MSSSHQRPPAGRPVVIGLLGGIASGKSLVARLLAAEEGIVIDADRHAREVLRDPKIARRIEAEFGPGLLGADGLPDRQALAKRVFADPRARRRLEGWIHPRVRARIGAELAEARARGRSPIVLDVPLLLENDAAHGLVGECDLLVFVDSDPAERDRRAVARRGWEPGEVARREAAQMPLAQKRARADYVISNTRDRESLEREVAALRRSLVPQP